MLNDMHDVRDFICGVGSIIQHFWFGSFFSIFIFFINVRLSKQLSMTRVNGNSAGEWLFTIDDLVIYLQHTHFMDLPSQVAAIYIITLAIF